MKKHPEIKEIYHRFLKNEATAAELDLLFAYFEASEEAELRKLIAVDRNANVITEAEGVQRRLHLDDLQVRINSRIDAGIEKGSKAAKYPLRTYFEKSPVFRIAASLLLIAFLSFFLYKYLAPLPGNEIKPGGNYAVLITADGKKVDLKRSANATIAKVQGVIIRKTADGQIVYTASGNQPWSPATWNSIVTPLGGRYKITLSDGSRVILNSGSTLEFPVGFRSALRQVRLTGEAYFEVAKDPLKPFVVVSGNGSTEVLGTKFNVSDYPEDGMVKTTLLEGKVRFSSNDTRNSTVLEPGEQAILKGSDLRVSVVNAADFMAWKDNRFVFKNEELTVIMRELSRWYNVEIDYRTIPDRRLYANISADVNLEEVLKMLSVTSGLKFNVNGRRVSVMK